MPDPRRAPASLTGSEAIAAALVASASVVVVAAYLLDRSGFRFTPGLMLVVALASGMAALAWSARIAEWEPGDLLAFVSIVSLTFGWLMWLARPSFLPLGSGPDLTHHLLLIRYIEEHWRLVHVPGVEDYLGEMVYYTPGSHILAALAGAWARTSGFHAVHAVVAAAVALKVGILFLITMRVLPRDVPRVPLAIVAAAVLLASPTFFLGSFAEFSFLAQVVSELFAVAMWWALTAWDQEERWSLMIVTGLLGAAVFLTWPILVGPPLVLFGMLLLLPRAIAFRLRIVQAAVAMAPLAMVAPLFIAGRTGMMVIAGTSGRAVWPTVGAYGPWFLGATALGLGIAALRRRARSLVLFTMAIALQAGALYWFARVNSNEPYMALKMCYLMLFPQAVAAALAIGEVWSGLAGLVYAPRVQSVAHGDRLAVGFAWVVAIAIAVMAGRAMVAAPSTAGIGTRPATSLSLEQAGEWARGNLPVKCVEYLVSDPDTAYWLHLAVLGNARQGTRTAADATYDLTATLVRWLTPGGLPYAIADLPALPTSVRSELDIVTQFDTAAVVKRRGPSSCSQ